MSKTKKVSGQLRVALENHPKTINAIAGETGVDVANLYRWWRGDAAGLSSGTVDKLAEYLGLELRRRK